MKLSQIFKTEQNGRILLTLINLKWVTFLEIMQSQKHFLLDANYSDKKRYSKEDYKFYADYWLKLQDEAFITDDSFEGKDFIKKSMARLILVEKIRLMERDANMLSNFAEKYMMYKIAGRLAEYDANIQKIYAMIKGHEPKIQIKYFEPVEVNLKTMERVIASLVNEYNTEDKSIDSKVKKHQISGVREVLKVNRLLGTSLVYSEMFVMDWIEAKKEAREEIANRNKGKE